MGWWGTLRGLSKQTFTGWIEGDPSVIFVTLTKLSALTLAELFRTYRTGKNKKD